jgi:hypothetical protein
MHDMAVTLDSHHLGNAHRTEIGDPTNVIARKIDKHDVFRALFWIGQEFGGVPLVLRNCRATWARPSDRPNLDNIADKPDMHLRRAPDKRKIVRELEAEHIRRRIDKTETPVKIERVPIEIGFETLRQNDLEDIAGTDVFPGALNCLLELLAPEIAASRLRFAFFGRNEWKIGRMRELAYDGADRFSGSRIDLSIGPSSRKALTTIFKLRSR